MTNVESPVIFVVLEIRPQLHLIPDPGTEELSLGASKYRCVDSVIGFIDFLRNTNMEIIGIRFSPIGHHAVLDYALPLEGTYVNIERGYMEIYFHGHRGASVPGPAEQAFGEDAIWRNEMGVYALQVGTGRLTEAELTALKELTTH